MNLIPQLEWFAKVISEKVGRVTLYASAAVGPSAARSGLRALPSNSIRKSIPRITRTSRVAKNAGAALLCLAGLTLSVNATTYDVFPVGTAKSNWPTASQWQTVPGLQTSATNSGLSGTLSRLDFVGDATYPTAFYAYDTNYVYFRVRINAADPAYPDNTAWTHTIVLLIDSNNDKIPDSAFSWDTKGTGTDHQLELNMPDPESPNTTSSLWNTVNMIDRDGNTSSKTQPDFNTISGHTNDGYFRLVSGQPGPAGTNTTTFADFAVRWSYLTGTYNSAAISPLAPGQLWRVQFASINNGTDHANINADVAGAATLTTTLGTAGAWSDLIAPTNALAQLTVATPPSATAITYGQALSAATLSGGSATNAVGTAVAGSFAFTTPSTTPGAGAANQSVTFTPTDLTSYNTATGVVSVTVNKASTAVAVSSSLNPSGFSTNVTFTATLPAAATGNVIFKTNGVALTTATLTSGTASAATALLPRGTNTTTAEYAGDGNYLGSTNNLTGGQVVTNRPPVAGNATYARAAGSGLFINIAQLLTNVTQVAAGQTITLTSVGSGSQGATITINGASVRYAPLPNHNANDSFTYTVSDGQGGTATGNVAVNNKSVTGQNPGAVVVSTNSVTSRFAGVPTWTYLVQRSTNLTAGVGWVIISTNLVGDSGLITNVDTFTDLGARPASAYYQLQLQ